MIDGLTSDVPMPEVKPLKDEPKPTYEFQQDTEYDEIGYCFLRGGNFVTFIHATPCGAFIANTMDLNGWEIYVPPVSYYSKTYRKGKESYLVTYRKKNHG